MKTSKASLASGHK